VAAGGAGRGPARLWTSQWAAAAPGGGSAPPGAAPAGRPCSGAALQPLCARCASRARRRPNSPRPPPTRHPRVPPAQRRARRVRRSPAISPCESPPPGARRQRAKAGRARQVRVVERAAVQRPRPGGGGRGARACLQQSSRSRRVPRPPGAWQRTDLACRIPRRRAARREAGPPRDRNTRTPPGARPGPPTPGPAPG
jgi:hypothetical protein